MLICGSSCSYFYILYFFPFFLLIMGIPTGTCREVGNRDGREKPPRWGSRWGREARFPAPCPYAGDISSAYISSSLIVGQLTCNIQLKHYINCDFWPFWSVKEGTLECGALHSSMLSNRAEGVAGY